MEVVFLFVIQAVFLQAVVLSLFFSFSSFAFLVIFMAMASYIILYIHIHSFFGSEGKQNE